MECQVWTSEWRWRWCRWVFGSIHRNFWIRRFILILVTSLINSAYRSFLPISIPTISCLSFKYKYSFQFSNSSTAFSIPKPYISVPFLRPSLFKVHITFLFLFLLSMFFYFSFKFCVRALVFIFFSIAILHSVIINLEFR